MPQRPLRRPPTAGGHATNQSSALTDWVPHAVNGRLRSPVALEPVRKADVVQGTYIPHAALGVKQRAYDWGGTQGKRVSHLVNGRQLRGGEESFQT